METEGGMSFVDIGKVIGCSPTLTWAIYQNALRKIRKNNSKATLKRWRELVELRRKLRDGGQI